ncbi:MAG: hypothetical protein IJD92_02610 [Bacilli bacterium]|nr:hypothetical protein [Bacilli bacterium]
MNDLVDIYLNKSKTNLKSIVKCLEQNIIYLDNSIWSNNSEFELITNRIIDIYYDKYYIYTKNDFKIIDKYIKFNKNINRKLKCILLAIIDYYEEISESNKLSINEGSILYLTILIYLGIKLYNTNFNNIDTPKKIQSVINNIIDYFAKITFRKDRNLESLINNIREYVEWNNEFNSKLNNVYSKDSKNMFVKINNKDNFYKVLYEYNINELNSFDNKDISIVNNKINLGNVLSNISLDLSYITLFKALSNGLNYIFLFEVDKDFFTEENIKKICSKNDLVTNNIKFVIDYDKIEKDYDFINMIKSNNIDLYIDVVNSFETNNYNMFMDMKNIIISEDFLNMNEKYKEIWKDMGLNFIVKNMSNKLNEKRLLSRK